MRDQAIKQRKREYYMENREYIKAKSHKHYHTHKEEYMQYTRKFGNNRKNALERDGYKCCHCGSTKKLAVHHIDGNGRGKPNPNNELSNLQTLCNICHSRVHHPHIATWSTKYLSCVSCGTTTVPHHGFGRCNRCYKKQRALQKKNKNMTSSV
jgi:hypothetical protein